MRLSDLRGKSVNTLFNPGYTNSHGSRYRRSRRSAEPLGSPSKLKLDLHTNSRDIHLWLHDSVKIAAPTARIEWLELGMNVTASRPIHDGCLYEAVLENNTRFGGFVSICGVIVSMSKYYNSDPLQRFRGGLVSP